MQQQFPSFASEISASQSGTVGMAELPLDTVRKQGPIFIDALRVLFGKSPSQVDDETWRCFNLALRASTPLASQAFSVALEELEKRCLNEEEIWIKSTFHQLSLSAKQLESDIGIIAEPLMKYYARISALQSNTAQSCALRLESLLSLCFLHTCDISMVMCFPKVCLEQTPQTVSAKTAFYGICAILKDTHLSANIHPDTVAMAFSAMMLFLPGGDSLICSDDPQAVFSPEFSQIVEQFHSSELLHQSPCDGSGQARWGDMGAFHKWWHTTTRICCAVQKSHDRLVGTLFASFLVPSDMCSERVLAVVLFLVYASPLNSQQALLCDVLDMIALVCQSEDTVVLYHRFMEAAALIVRCAISFQPDLLPWVTSAIEKFVGDSPSRLCHFLPLLPVDVLDLLHPLLKDIDTKIAQDSSIVTVLSKAVCLPWDIGAACWKFGRQRPDAAKCLALAVSSLAAIPTLSDEQKQYIQELIEYIAANSLDVFVHSVGCDLLEALACFDSSPWTVSVIHLLFTLLFAEGLSDSRHYDAGLAAASFAQQTKLSLASVLTPNSLNCLLHALRPPASLIVAMEKPEEISSLLLTQLMSSCSSRRRRRRELIEELLPELVQYVQQAAGSLPNETEDAPHATRILQQMHLSLRQIIGDGE